VNLEPEPLGALGGDQWTVNTVYAARGGVFRTTDGGAHWTAVNTRLTATVFALVIDPATPTTKGTETACAGEPPSPRGGGFGHPPSLVCSTLLAGSRRS
jgi:hypothetical protein